MSEIEVEMVDGKPVLRNTPHWARISLALIAAAGSWPASPMSIRHNRVVLQDERRVVEYEFRRFEGQCGVFEAVYRGDPRDE